MARLKLATIATVATGLAFAFELIGVVSTPVTRKISLAKFNGYQYGWGGVCPTDTSKECLASSVSVGYDLHDVSFWYIGPDGQKILTELLISHVVAAGCLLIGAILVGSTHVENSKLRLAVAIIMVPFFLVTLMSFIVEILLWGTKLQFAGWFTLAASVLSMLALSALFAQIPRTPSADKKRRGKVELTRGGSFVIGALGGKKRHTLDQERLISSEKEPAFVSQPRSFNRTTKPFPPQMNQVPVSVSGATKPATEKQWNHPLPPQPQGRPSQFSNPVVNPAGVTPQRQAQKQQLQPPFQEPKTQPKTQDQPESQKWNRKVPAGAYLSGVDYSSDGYGPNVVGIPKVRSSPSRQQEPQQRGVSSSGPAPQVASQTAVYDYVKPEQPAPPAHNNVPNYSRLASSPNMGYMAQVKKDRVEQYVSEPSYQQPAYFEPPPNHYPPPSPQGSESSHYTSVSQRPPQGYGAPVIAQPQQLRSDFVLAHNPDFTLGGLPAGGRRNGRPRTNRPSY